jgi:D-alanyl-D-alanine carboxypeptidase
MTHTPATRPPDQSRTGAGGTAGPRRAGALGLILLLLALVAAVVPAGAGAAVSPGRRSASGHLDPRTAARLERALRTTWAQTWSPGVIAGVWIGNRSWTSALGSTQRAAGPRPSLDDHTRVGSVTKLMVGTLILELVDQHKLSLDETIQRWFPKVPDANRITIRELGDMSSGIDTYTVNPKLTDQYFLHPTMWWNPNVLIAGGTMLPRKFPVPGDGFFYSDTNLVMLGRIIERVTHKPLAQVMRADLYKPLGMDSSSFPTSNRMPAPFLRGYTVQGSEDANALDATHWSPSFAAGAGAAISTLDDLHRLAVAVGTGELLKPATQRQRLIPNPASVAGGRAYLFALGYDHGWLGHEGEIPGYNTYVAYLPSLKASIVVIANCDIADANSVTPVHAIVGALARVISPNHVPGG